MNKKDAQKRIEKLKETIDKHRFLYHVYDIQELEEEALESLKKELFDLEQKFPDLITADSPTQRVGGNPLDQFKKVEHIFPMLSFQDAFSKNDMLDWKKRIEKFSKEEINEFFCEYKIDGLAIELVYQNSKLKTASTRGDGRLGEDVTENIKTIESIPLKLRNSRYFSEEEKKFSDDPDWQKENKDIIVRGEVFIFDNEFKRINKEKEKKGESLYANSRNLAAGSIRQLDPKIVAHRKLSFFAYDLVSNLKKENQEPFGVLTHSQKHKLLKALGFKTTEEKKCNSIEEVFDFREKVSNKRKDIGYQIDGIAVFVNNNNVFKELGVAGKAPRGGIAYKFDLKKATTQVEDIKIQIGRTGSATPVALLRPVSVGGVVISRASVHNEDEINRLGLKIGDTVIVGRAGDVIPYIIKVLPEMRNGSEKKFLFPKVCPICKSPLIKKEHEVVKRCLNENCLAQRKEQFNYFVSKNAFNIDGLGESIINQLVDSGLISDFVDIFKLKKEDLLLLERFAEKSADNLIESIKKSKNISLPKFIYSLGIRQVGQKTALDLSENFSSIKKIKEATLEDFLSLRDIGPISAKAIHDWFSDKKNIKMIDELLLEDIKIEIQERKNQLKGKRFVFTGKLNSFSREEAEEKVIYLGGRVSSSISKNIDYLVAGEDPGSKLEKAKKENINIISEKDFQKMI